MSTPIKTQTPQGKPNTSHQPKSVGQWIQDHISEELVVTWNTPWLTVQIHRPAQRNALNGHIIHLLKTLFDFIEAQKEIRAVILTGGKKAYCSGADLQEIAKLRASGPTALIQNNQNYGELLHRMHLCRVPIISTVDGPALGGGMGLVCASDLILATVNSSFGMPEPKLGIIAGQIFPYVFRKLGVVRTQEMALQGLRIKGHAAANWGLINELFETYDDMLAGLNTTLAHILSCGPEAIAHTKKMLSEITSISHQNIQQTAKDVVQATLSAEGIEGGTAFLTKRKPSWNQTKAMES